MDPTSRAFEIAAKSEPRTLAPTLEEEVEEALESGAIREWLADRIRSELEKARIDGFRVGREMIASAIDNSHPHLHLCCLAILAGIFPGLDTEGAISAVAQRCGVSRQAAHRRLLEVERQYPKIPKPALVHRESGQSNRLRNRRSTFVCPD